MTTGAVVGDPMTMICALCFVVQAALYWRFGGPRWQWVITATGLVIEVLLRGWAAAAVTGGALVAIIGSDWWNRRGRKAARDLGAKSRARVGALLGALRDLGQPVPEGAR